MQCTLYGIPQAEIKKLQAIQNCAARLVTRTKKYDHITPILKRLHWLPVKWRLQYKVLLLTYKALNGKAPSYISELLTAYSPKEGLRSSEQKLLAIPRTKLKTYGPRSFSVAAPSLWNSLPLSLRDPMSLDSFKVKLKTHLMQLAYKNCNRASPARL